MRGGFIPPRMRREVFRRILHEMSRADWHRPASGHVGWHSAWEDSWHHGCGERPTAERRLAILEEYQRDLEQQVADVATKIKRLREEMAGAGGSGQPDA